GLRLHTRASLLLLISLFSSSLIPPPLTSTLFPYTTLFRSCGNIIKQLLVICPDILLRIVRADAEDNCPVAAQIFARHLLRWDYGDVQSNLFQHSWNVIARAHDVPDLHIVWNLYIHNADALNRRLIVMSALQIFARDQAVSLGVS